MSESNANLAQLAQVVADLEAAKRDPRAPVNRAGTSTPSVLLNDAGVPIMVQGKAVDFDHLVELSQVVHPATIEVSTLRAVVDWYASGKGAGHFIQISSSCMVSVRADDVRVDGGRDNVLKATFSVSEGHFDQWMAVDEFSSWLLSGFVPNDGSEALYAALGRGVKAEAVREAAAGAGGFEVRTKEGAKFEWLGDAGPRFQLAYICTFPEVSQPDRACVARCREHDSGVQVKLVDADGGAWKSTAIASIAEWLRGHNELKGVTILG